MFGFGHGPELLIILAIALIVLGPGKIPEIAQMLGKGLRELRQASADLQRTFDVNELMNPTPPATPEPPANPSVSLAPGESVVLKPEEPHQGSAASDSAAIDWSAALEPVSPAASEGAGAMGTAGGNGSAPTGTKRARRPRRPAALGVGAEEVGSVTLPENHSEEATPVEAGAVPPAPSSRPRTGHARRRVSERVKVDLPEAGPNGENAGVAPDGTSPSRRRPSKPAPEAVSLDTPV